MASQSPADLPINQAAAGQAQDYIRAWQATAEMLRRGHNWSGHESNVCFLNMHGSKFVDISAVSGFDHFDDTRGVAVVDWDGDGDLDLWTTNRTSPRVRYLRNESSSSGRFVAVKLRGVECNRDAIGARVELHRGANPADRLIQTVRAGEGYLTQSSKTVHFGLGEGPPIEKVVVRWPGGAVEEFTDVAAGDCFELVQGEGVARKLDRRPLPAGSPLTEVALSRPGGESARVVAARRLPLPSLECATLAGEPLRLDGELSGPRLILLWAPWCQPCLAELGNVAENAARLRDVGVDVVPVNVDGAKPELAGSLAASAEVLKSLGFEGNSGLATTDFLDYLDIAQRVLTNKPFPPPIPSSFLLDGDGRLVCVYKGPVQVDQLIRDVQGLQATHADPRSAALPFEGRWYTAPFPPDLLAIPIRLIQLGKLNAAMEYLVHVESSENAENAEFVQLFASDLADAYVDLAKQFAAGEQFDSALAALQRAAAHQADNWDIHFGMAAIYARLGRQREAADEYRVLLRLQPGHALASRNLAWILATSSETSLRRPAEAVRFAEAACEATGYRSPADLDALAAAYASAGRFEQAVSTARRAVAILAGAGQQGSAAALRERLRQYEQGRAIGE